MVWWSWAWGAEPMVLETDADVLAALEARGFGFGELLAESKADEASAWGASKRWTDLRAVVTADTASVTKGDRQAGSTLAHSHRRFDPGWLALPTTHFELVGVTNRMDRVHVHPDTCGEWRLVYRLAVDTPVETRLPFTVILAFPNGADCEDVARTWTWDPAKYPDRAAWLANGPLARTDLLAVEVNWQAVRWPSSTQPDLGGHAAYAMRVLLPEGDGLVPTPLENTPDTERLLADPVLKAELLTWLRANEAAVATGNALVPERFLARLAVGVSPGGLERSDNQPWTTLYAGTLPNPLLRSLDATTCQGCHQVDAVAGFHLLGDDRTVSATTLVSGISPHLAAVQEWRTEQALRLGRGETLGVRPAVEIATGAYGDPCDAARTCDAGLQCTHLHAEDRGLCLPPAGFGGGNVCELGRLESSATPWLDRRVPTEIFACVVDGAPAECRPTAGGFPGGLCRGRCATEGATAGDRICAGMVEGPFSACIAAGTPMDRCLAENQSLFTIRSCDAKRPCREDYACSGVAGAPAGVGACRPTYALLQLRVDSAMPAD